MTGVKRLLQDFEDSVVLVEALDPVFSLLGCYSRPRSADLLCKNELQPCTRGIISYLI